MAAQLEQLLTCCICLDRFRNPKLLPCQHSVCMEPCMEGLVDYVRRQVKCPECRAEHRIPYNGVQGFPANVTLQRFLEAHIEITGETPDPFTGQIMERCGVCNEKNYLSACAHCEKKICADCKAAHTDILKREIGRINNQVKRAVHRLGDQLSIVERNINALKQNTDSVTEEVDNISKRLQKAIKDRAEFIRNEVMNYYRTEQRNLTLLKEGLEQELSNVESNSELADKHMNDQTNWDDCELMDAKDIFLRTMEFIRSFDYEAGDYNRRARFNAPDDLNKMASNLSSFGELIIHNPKQTIDPFSSNNNSSMQTGLSKSKSDHRLAAQFREEDSYSYNIGKTSPIARRRFGDRLHPTEEPTHDTQNDLGRRRFRSRFMRREEDDERSNKPHEEEVQPKPRTKVIDTEDVSRGPLSGITKMVDSPRVIQRLQEKEGNFKKKEVAPKTPPVQQTPKQNLTFGTPRRTTRQLSEDEIEKIKKQNKTEPAPSTSTNTTATSLNSSHKPSFDRLTSIKDSERSGRNDRNATPTSPRVSINSQSSPVIPEGESSRRTSRDYGSGSTSTVTSPNRKVSAETGTTNKTFTFSRSSSTSSVEGGRSSTSGANGQRSTENASQEVVKSRSNSTDSNISLDGVAKPEEVKNRFQRTASNETKQMNNRSASGGSTSKYQSRFTPRASTPSAEAQKESDNDDDDEEESSEDSESEESEATSEEEQEEEEKKPSYSRPMRSQYLSRSTANGRESASNVNPNDSGYGSSSSTSRYRGNTTSSTDVNSTRKPMSLSETNGIKDNNEDLDSKYPYASKLLNRSRANTNNDDEKQSFHSRFLNKSKSSAVVNADPNKDENSNLHTSGMGTSRAKFEELKERRQRLARSKSSVGVDDDETPSTNESNQTSYRSRYGHGREADTTSSSTRNGTTSTTTEDPPATTQLSNWARYLKNKYGNKSNTSQGNSNTSSAGASSGSKSSSAISRSRSSHLLGLAKENESIEDDSKNVYATPTSQAVGTLGPTPFGNIHRSKYLNKQKLLYKIGSRGSEPEHFTWPRGIAIGPDDSIVVADSSNHRAQVFDKYGKYVKSFGSYGNGEGEFDCLAGVAINRIGQFIVADRYNHRIQIFDCSGMFIRMFGNQGSGDGKFSYPWGVTTDNLGYIYVCDKENHRIQVFESDGTFVGKFGSLGSKPGQLEHPHYIAVSSSNEIIVSDSNNHRIQVFDINGKVMNTFGSEGSDEGQFKFPRGVAVDTQGFIFVADSGNNRIQIFHPDGSFLRAFGCWGSAPGEFKGLEGVGVMSNGNILICDRENHRIQVF